MRKLISNKYIQGLAIFLFFAALTAFVLRGFAVTGQNFWTDFSGNIDLNAFFSKSQYLWTSNQLGVFQFSSPANLWFHLFVKAMYSIFGLAHGTYFVFYFLVLSSFGAAYFMARSVTEDKRYPILFSFLLVINPLYLYYLFGTGTITLVAAFTGLYLAFGFYQRYLKVGDKIYLVGLLLSSILISHPFLFPFFCLVFGYLLWREKGRKTALTFLGWALLLHAYWIIPFISSFLFSSQSLLGSYTTGLIDIFSANGLYQYSFLFLGRSYTFIKEFYGYGEVLVYLFIFLVWLILIRWSLVNKRSKEIYIYWPLIMLLLIFSIGPRLPYGTLYSFLLEKFSFFSFFRSYQNVFIILFPLVGFVLVRVAIQKESYKKVLGGLSLAALVLFAIFANRQLISRGSKVPDDYFQASQIVNADQASGRVLLLPVSQYDYYSWDKPLEDKYFLEAFFGFKGISFYRPTIDNPMLRNLYDKLYSDSDFNYKDLTDIGIQYILVRKDLTHQEDGYFQKFDREIDTSKADLVLDTRYISLYKIKAPQPYIVAQGATFQRVSPIKYNLSLKAVRPGETIYFKESYNSGWGLYPSSIDLSGCQGSNMGSEKECSALNSELTLSDVSLLRSQTVAGVSHIQTNGFGSQWTLSADDINNLPSYSRRDNGNGTYDINLELYFKPQSYSYLGLIFTGVSVIFGALYLLVSGRNQKNVS